MKLTLTFDNGPDPAITPFVLDVLARHRLRAVFFVLGKLIEHSEGRTLVKRMLDEGHLVGNHSYSHAVPLGDDPRSDAVENEIGRTHELLASIHSGPLMFRPFGGGGVLGPHLLSPQAATYLVRHGYSCVLWNSVPRDWEQPETWPDLALTDLSKQPHTVMVLHDVEGACALRLDDFLVEIKTRGHDVVTDFPPPCVPIRDGEIVCDLNGLVRGSLTGTKGNSL